MTSPYDAPSDLPEEDAEAKCETDVTILLEEPNVRGTSSSRPSGASWIGVPGITVVLVGGGNSFSSTSNGSGRASFSDVPCGAYTIRLEQEEFRIETRETLSMNVSATRKSGREKDIRIQRQLLTVEMFRLPTQLYESIRVSNPYVRKTPDPNSTGDPYGHHWMVIYSSEANAASQSPSESYGWWPRRGTAGFPDFLTGVPGDLNGQSYGGTPTRDPYHADPNYPRGSSKLEDNFFPYVTNGKTAAQYKADIKSKAQAFPTAVSNQWSWRGDGSGWHCKTFQAYLMREVRLWKRVGIGLGSYGWSANV